MNWNWQIIFTSFPDLLKASVVTIELVVLSSVIGLVFGVVLGLLRLAKNPLVSTLPFLYIFFFGVRPFWCKWH